MNFAMINDSFDGQLKSKFPEQQIDHQTYQQRIDFLDK